MEVERALAQFQERIGLLRQEIGKAIVGHDAVVEHVLIALVAGGHVLLEGVPGLGKTLLVRTLSQALSLRFSRIQFTPDLMPADILGTNIVVEDEGGRRGFQFQRGPIFGNIVLADEVNRATPKTQSALLEAMQEQCVTVSGVRYPLEEPFFVLATQNPIEMEGTYPLPEAQLDRFLFKVLLGTPPVDEIVDVLERTTGRAPTAVRQVLAGPDVLAMRALAREVPIASHVIRYAARIVSGTHPTTPEATSSAKRYVRYGASIRGGQAMVLGAKILALLRGRYNVSFEDIRTVATPALRHRLILNFEGEAEGVKTDDLVAKVIQETPELPREVEKFVAKMGKR